MNYKVIAIAIIILLLLILWAVWAIKKHINKMNILFSGSVVVVLSLCIIFINISSVDDYYLSHLDDITPQSKTVTLYIDCKTALTKSDNKYMPKNGVILKKTEYVLRENDTVFDILARALKHNKIQFEYSGKAAYIEGINYLYEFDCGSLSGWMYYVNGKSADQGCGEYIPKDGDEIAFIYTCNIGKDGGTP